MTEFIKLPEEDEQKVMKIFDDYRHTVNGTHFKISIALTLVKENNKKVLYVISDRPGIVIGKYGTNIDELREKVCEALGEKIEVHVKEFPNWQVRFFNFGGGIDGRYISST